MKRATENLPVKPYISKRQRLKNQEDNRHQATLQQQDDIISTINPVADHIPHHCIPKKILVKQKEHSKAVTSVNWNPNVPHILASTSLDSQIILWSVSKKSLSVANKLATHELAVKDCKWNLNGKHLLTGSFDKSAKVTDVQSGAIINSFKHKDLVTSVLYHPERDDIFLSGTLRSGVFAWDTRLGKVIREYFSSSGQTQDLLFLPNNSTFLVSSECLNRNSMDKAIQAWDFDTGAVLSNQIYQEPHTCSSLRLHCDGQVFLAQSSGGYIAKFLTERPYKMNKYQRFEGYESAGYNIKLDISKDGRHVLCGDNAGRLSIFDFYSTKLLHLLDPFTSACMDVACHPSHSSQTVCASWDGEIAILE